jgi:hypothetical protein
MYNSTVDLHVIMHDVILYICVYAYISYCCSKSLYRGLFVLYSTRYFTRTCDMLSEFISASHSVSYYSIHIYMPGFLLGTGFNISSNGKTHLADDTRASN